MILPSLVRQLFLQRCLRVALAMTVYISRVDAGTEAFCHRLGHNIGRKTHGNGANMDNLETRDERSVMRQTCFSIEPGIYLSEFGVRTEVDVFIDTQGQVHVTGGERQMKVVPILAEF